MSLLLALLGYTSCNFNEAQKRAQLNLQLGFELYMRDCANCHQPDGTGLAKVIPPLKNSDWLVQNKNRLPEVIKYGIKENVNVNGTSYSLPMPADSTLSLKEITALSNFVLLKYANASEFFTEDEVAKLLYAR
ncbi:MAG: c-type cytochrome [Bacteroidia bacterium]